MAKYALLVGSASEGAVTAATTQAMEPKALSLPLSGNVTV